MKMLLTMLAWVAVATAAQETPAGTIEGTVVRQGTTDPIPDVQITIGTGSGPALGQRQAQAVLDAVSGGTAGLPEELLEAAQNALRGGARGSVASAPLTAVSDSAGHFVFRNVPIGNRVVRVQLQGYFGAPINGNYPATVTSNVTVTAEQTTQIRFSLIPGGTISGRVLDPAGKPLADSPVQALRALYQNGVRTLGIVDLKPTDDRGEYRIARLPPGEYYVSASPRRTPNGRSVAAPNSSEVIVVTLYPNATDLASARPIVLREGDDQSGMNIQIRSAAGAKVSGKVISSLPPATGQRGQARPSVATSRSCLATQQQCLTSWVVLLFPPMRPTAPLSFPMFRRVHTSSSRAFRLLFLGAGARGILLHWQRARGPLPERQWRFVA